MLPPAARVQRALLPRVERRVSLDLQRERRRQHATGDSALEKEPPRSTDRLENADGELPGGRRRAGHLRAAEEARAVGRARRTHVRVEVRERSLAEEDRVRQRSVPGREL